MKFFKNLKKIKLISDIINLFNYKKNEKNYHSVFFTENKYTFVYLEGNLKSQLKKKVVLISFEDFDVNFLINKFCFQTNFFRQIFFLSIRIKYLYCTTPDLNFSLFVKSVYKKTKYIYLQHSPVGLIYKYRQNAFDYFDAVQVINTFQYNDLKKIIKRKKLKIKIIKSKYSFLEILNKQSQKFIKKNQILVAPTWNTNFYKEKLHEIIIKNLENLDAKLHFRPHPMSLKNNEINFEELQRLGYQIDNNHILNFSNFTQLITDWSGVFIEFAIVKKKKPILFNTSICVPSNKKKLTNNDFEFFSRNLIGNVINIRNSNNLKNIILSNNNTKNHKEIADYFNKYFYN